MQDPFSKSEISGYSKLSLNTGSFLGTDQQWGCLRTRLWQRNPDPTFVARHLPHDEQTVECPSPDSPHIPIFDPPIPCPGAGHEWFEIRDLGQADVRWPHRSWLFVGQNSRPGPQILAVLSLVWYQPSNYWDSQSWPDDYVFHTPNGFENCQTNSSGPSESRALSKLQNAASIIQLWLSGVARIRRRLKTGLRKCEQKRWAPTPTLTITLCFIAIARKWPLPRDWAADWPQNLSHRTHTSGHD